MSIAILRNNIALAIINSLHMTVFSALTLLLPLYLADLGFSLESIGLTLAIMPVILLVSRTLLSMVADAVGGRFIFLTEALGMALAVVTYTMASTPLLFSVGKVFEGVGHSAFWAVIRTEIYRAAPKSEERFASFMQSLRTLGEFAGRALGGLIVFYLGFTHTFWVLLLLVAILLPAAWKFRRVVRKPLDWKSSLRSLWAGRSRSFWHVAWVMALAACFYSGVDFFLYPLYMKQLGFNTLFIGLLLALYSVVSGISMLLTTQRSWGVRRVAAGILIFGVLPSLFINRLNPSNAVFLVGSLAAGEALANILFEKIIARITKSNPNVSTEIAVLHVPYRIAEFIILAALGFLVSAFGFYAAFLGVAFALVLFTLLASNFLVRTDPAYTAIGYTPWAEKLL